MSRDRKDDVPPPPAPPDAKVNVRREADGVTVFTATPDAGAEDLVLAFAAFMHEGPTPLVLWDLRLGTFRRVMGEELRSMVGQLIALSGNARAAGRSAFVVAHDVDYGLTRMIITHAELSGYVVPLQVFRDVDAARAWLLRSGPVA
jgi:hypothetical protein